MMSTMKQDPFTNLSLSLPESKIKVYSQVGRLLIWWPLTLPIFSKIYKMRKWEDTGKTELALKHTYIFKWQIMGTFYPRQSPDAKLETIIDKADISITRNSSTSYYMLWLKINHYIKDVKTTGSSAT